MDMDIIDFHLFTDHSLRGLDMVNVEKADANEDDHINLFVNYATIAWHEMRRAWRGDQSDSSQRKPREPTRHHLSTVEEKSLASTKPFDGPVPLSKMVKFLVEVWGEEDLQD